jgi:hypothetical protein
MIAVRATATVVLALGFAGLASAQIPVPASGIIPESMKPQTYGTNKPEYWMNAEERQAAQTVRAWFAAWQAGDPLLLGAFVNRNVIYRTDPKGEIFRGRDTLLKEVCGHIGGRLDLTELYVVGADFEQSVIARWNKVSANGAITKMGSHFRVQQGLVVEWLDVQLEGTPTAANANAAACARLNTALAATAAPGPAAGGRAGGPGGAPPAGAPPAL